jgi:hypothetical protein
MTAREGVEARGAKLFTIARRVVRDRGAPVKWEECSRSLWSSDDTFHQVCTSGLIRRVLRRHARPVPHSPDEVRGAKPMAKKAKKKAKKKTSKKK